MSDKIIETIKWSLDSLTQLHQGQSFNIPAPVYMDVICKFKDLPNETIKIDLAKIKEYLNRDSLGYPYKFVLHIEVELETSKRKWLIPSNSLALANENELTLDSKWDVFTI